MKTFMPKAAEIKRDWYVVDASGKTLGRLASRVAAILAGKTKPIYSPHVDTGDFVVVINASKIVLTGKKAETKIYYRHSGFHGGLREIPAGKMLAADPEQVIRRAVKGMLPKTSLGRKMLSKCKVFVGDQHDHQAQQPKSLEV